MQGTISFHPVELSFFDDLACPLLAGEKVNPEEYLRRSLQLRASVSRVRDWARTIELLLEASEPPPIDGESSLWGNLRARVERLGQRPDELSREVARLIEPELHLSGRPFFVTETSAKRVAEVVEEYRNAGSAEAVDDLVREQLVGLDADLARQIDPDVGGGPGADLPYRTELLAELRWLYDVGCAARENRTWTGAGGDRRPAGELLCREAPWRVTWLHSRGMPFWTAENVDGLETVCRAAELAPPEFLVSPRRPFAGAIEMFPGLPEALDPELRRGHDVGACVAPDDLPRLLDFLNASGSTIIRAATRYGEGAACRRLLRKIRECATFAARHGLGYLEASGIEPAGREETGD